MGKTVMHHPHLPHWPGRSKFLRYRNGFGVFIKHPQAPGHTQPRRNGTRMATAPERRIDINTLGLHP